MNPLPVSPTYSWWRSLQTERRRAQAGLRGKGWPLTSLSPLQNCGLPSFLDGPGPFTVFAPSNEAVDGLRDGRLVYLFTAVSS